MSIVGVVDHIDKLLDKLTPYASIVGVEKITEVINSAVDIAEMLVENINNAEEVINSDDLASLQAWLAAIRSKNDSLHERVKNS